jgi:biotin carboxylase
MKKLIIIGANNFQVPLIKKANEMGLETHVFAWEEGAFGKQFANYFYPISIIEKEQILEIAKNIKPAGVVSIASDLASITVSYLTNALGLTGNNLQCTEVTTDKYLMRDLLSRYDLPCPRFCLLDGGNNKLVNRLSYPLIVKPTDRSGSRGVSKVDYRSLMNLAIERAFSESFNKRVIVEEFITGKEYSIEMISWQGKHQFIQITEKETSGTPYFVEKAQHQPAKLEDKMVSKIINIIKKALTVLEVEYGATHSEIIVSSENEIYITEIGARMGGDYIGSDLVELSTGFDFVKAVVEVALGNEPKIKITRHNFSGVYYVLPKPGKLLEVVDNSSDFKEIIRTEVYYKIGNIIPEIRESNQRAACYVYRSMDKKFFCDNVVKFLVE